MNKNKIFFFQNHQNIFQQQIFFITKQVLYCKLLILKRKKKHFSLIFHIHNISDIIQFQQLLNQTNLQQHKMQKYKIIKTMGDGAFGVVFKAVTPKNEIVAIKKFKQKYSSWDQCLQLREIKSLKKLDHPNIIKLKQVILANNELYLVFDFIETNLYQVYVRANQSKRTLTQGQIKSIFFKITHALGYLHKNGFFHRDLKPENILCHNNELKICDFGLARQIRSKPPFTQYVSTRWYRAPELLLHSGSYNYPVDIFALGCIIIQLYTMQPLFPGNNQVQTMNKVVQLLGTPKKDEWPEGYKLASKINYNFPQKKKKQLIDLIPHANPDIIDLLESMLNYNSKKRPTASQILRHEYFDSVNNKSSQPVVDSMNQTKFSFYQKQSIIQIPKNIKVQNPKQMQMRRSMIKFGNSFTSSFHLQKQQKKLKEQNNSNSNSKQKMDEIISSSNKKISNLNSQRGQKESASKQNKYSFNKGKHQDEITKKFDEMEEILMQLQQKQKSAKKQQKKDKRKSDQPFKSSISGYQDLNKYEMSGPAGFIKKQNSNNNFTKNQSQQIKLQGFIFGGLNNIASNNNLKNLIGKYPQK